MISAIASTSNVGRTSAAAMSVINNAVAQPPTKTNSPRIGCQQPGRIRQQLKIRIGHESTLACAPNRVRPDSVRARVHPESRLPVPEVGRGRDRATPHAERFYREAQAPRPGYRRHARAKPEAGRWRQQSRFLAARLHTRSECPLSLRHVRRERRTSIHGPETLPVRKYWVCLSMPDHAAAGKLLSR